MIGPTFGPSGICWGTGRIQVAWQVVETCREKAGSQAVGSQGHAGLREPGRSEGGAVRGRVCPDQWTGVESGAVTEPHLSSMLQVTRHFHLFACGPTALSDQIRICPSQAGNPVPPCPAWCWDLLLQSPLYTPRDGSWGHCLTVFSPLSSGQ